MNKHNQIKLKKKKIDNFLKKEIKNKNNIFQYLNKIIIFHNKIIILNN